MGHNGSVFLLVLLMLVHCGSYRDGVEQCPLKHGKGLQLAGGSGGQGISMFRLRK